RITVLKDGKTIAAGLEVSETPTAELIQMMTERHVESDFGGAPVETPGEVVLEVKDLALEGIFDDVNFSGRAGEVVGLAGLVGAGRSEILETLYGARKSTRGSVTVKGRKVRPGDVGSAVEIGRASGRAGAG